MTYAFERANATALPFPTRPSVFALEGRLKEQLVARDVVAERIPHGDTHAVISGAVSLQLNDTVERMVASKPRTVAEIAAVARALKEWGISNYWDETPEDRDWDVNVITDFIDNLIEAGKAEAAQ